MKTQDGHGVDMERRDEQLQVENQFGVRQQKVTDDELVAQIPKGDYAVQQPISLYTEALKNKAVV